MSTGSSSFSSAVLSRVERDGDRRPSEPRSTRNRTSIFSLFTVGLFTFYFTANGPRSAACCCRRYDVLESDLTRVDGSKLS